jgi:GxxExxY protein
MLQVSSPLTQEDEAIVTKVIDCAFAVHRALGPGYKERIYEMAFCLELESRNVRFECEKPVSVRYREWVIPGQRIDLIVEKRVVVEIKAMPRLRMLHRRQLVSYLRTLDLKAGILLNFNTSYIKRTACAVSFCDVFLRRGLRDRRDRRGRAPFVRIT